MTTYDEIFERMKNRYIADSGCEFDNASDIAIRLRLLAGEIYNVMVNQEWLKSQMFVTTASGEYLDYLASQSGLTRKQAVKAQGELTFYITEPKDHDVIIPKGAVAATTDSTPIRFCSTEEGCIVAGNTLVSVYAEAEKAGKGSNVEMYKAVVKVNVPTEVDSVTNRDEFVGGTDEESDEDLRQRIKSTYASPSNGTNKAYYEQLALSVEGIAKAGIVPKLRGVGTVDVFVCGNGVEADNESVKNVQKIMNENRELNVDVKVSKAQIYNANLEVVVNAVSGYENSVVIEKCKEAFTQCLDSIPIGGKMYLSSVGKYLMNTGCIENYEFNTSMGDIELSASQCFAVGVVTIGVR